MGSISVMVWIGMGRTDYAAQQAARFDAPHTL